MSLSSAISVATIGFTQSTAERFFTRLQRANVKTVIDVRLHNTSQLAAFAKADDLAFFLQQIGGIKYAYQRFLELMAERKIENKLKPSMFKGACLLCSEALPHHCHRRLVCEYLNDKWD